MAWERLRTDYKDAVWPGLKRYVLIDNGDNTISLRDVTIYTVYDESFFGALDANRINEAINRIVAALENGTDLYEIFTEFFENQQEAFKGKATLDLDTFNVFLDNLKSTANSDVTQMKKDYTAEITQFEKNQEDLFTQWFDLIKGQLSADQAGKLQIEINDLTTHIKNLAVKIHIKDTVGTAAAVVMKNSTTGNSYRITDFTQPIYVTEAGDYTLECENDSYMVAPRTVNISNVDLMTHKTFKLIDGNGFGFVDGYIGCYVNK